MKNYINRHYKFREKMPVYLGAPPKATSKSVSRSMKSNKAKDTKPELILRKALFSAGIRGYRFNAQNVPGRPDICFVGEKVAIFVNGCFWHRCPRCGLPLPKSNRSFWRKKFARNKLRDELKTRHLRHHGWRVHTFWECQIKEAKEMLVKKVQSILSA